MFKSKKQACFKKTLISNLCSDYSIISNDFFNFMTINSACPKSPVSDKKSSFSRLAKSGNPQFTNVNEEFSDKRNAENGVFLPTLNKSSIFTE